MAVFAGLVSHCAQPDGHVADDGAGCFPAAKCAANWHPAQYGSRHGNCGAAAPGLKYGLINDELNAAM